MFVRAGEIMYARTSCMQANGIRFLVGIELYETSAWLGTFA
jgi:hypothetical protein